MTQSNKQAAEQLLESAFADLLAIAQREGVTVKRMRELLSRAQLNAMRQQGMTQQEMMAASGYSLKTIRRLLRDGEPEDNTDLVHRFVGDWSSDPQFPNALPLQGHHFPCFVDLCARYGGDFTPPSLAQILVSRGFATVASQSNSELGENEHQLQYIQLCTKALTPVPGHEMLDFARQSIHSLLDTLNHNLAGHQPPRLERRLWSHRMQAAQLPELRERVRNHANRFREQVLKELDELESTVVDQTVIDPLDSRKNNSALANTEEKSTTRSKEPCRAVGLGLYWFELNS